MKSKEFITELSKRLEWSTQDVTDMLTDLNVVTGAKLADNDVINLQGFGQFEVKKKMERVSVNPLTQKRYLVPPKIVPVFKPSSSLKAKLKELTEDE